MQHISQQFILLISALVSPTELRDQIIPESMLPSVWKVLISSVLLLVEQSDILYFQF